LRQFKSILYRRKERIILPNENSDYVYYIAQGYVAQSILSSSGNQFTPYIFAPQTFFPLIWSEDEHEYESLTPVEVYRIPKEKLMSYLRENPKTIFILNQQLTAYSTELLKKLETRVFDNAIHMVILRLVDLAKLFGNQQSKQIIINYWFTHQDIANISGLSREVVTIQMNKLMKKKLISYKNHFIIINDLKLLETELQSEE
jgi:CRP/FNR family transcriptional regulator, cyclic AMP receptor protein